MPNWEKNARLLYVAMTRAREFLFCTCPVVGMDRLRAPAEHVSARARRQQSHFFIGDPVHS